MLGRWRKSTGLILWLVLIASLSWADFLSAQARQPQHNAEAGKQASERAYEALAATFKSFVAWFNTDVWIAFGTLAIAFLTGALWFIGRRQWLDSRILQRAYLSVEPQGIVPVSLDSVSGQIVVAHVLVRNAGNLPARGVRWILCVLSTHDPQFDPIDPSGVARPEGDNVMVPGAEMLLVTGPKQLPQTKDGDISTEGFIYVWGVIRYDDGFKTERHTRFCHRYNLGALKGVPSGGIGLGILAEDARWHPKGNTGD